ncbi:MAG: ABC transporter permease [Candidatus Bipolaricaulaceae bacterium]
MRAIWALIRKELLYLRAYPLDFANYAISPAFIVAPYIFFAKLFGFSHELLDSVAVGLLLWYWLSTLLGEVALGLEEDMEEGIFETLVVHPITIFHLLLAKAVVMVLENLYITGTMLAWFFFFGVPLRLPWWQFWGIVVLSGFGVAGFMLALAAVALIYKKPFVLYDLVQWGLGALSGVTRPSRDLPRALWLLSRAIPLSYGIEAARATILGRPVEGIPILLALGLLYFFLGKALLVAAERRMRAAGTTGEF